MKKNRFLKIAGCLMVLCLLTTCVIGTTFAKYVTGGETGDSARVAKWGVQLELSANNLFSNEYASDSAFPGVTVKSIDNASVVAPGTIQNTAARFSLSGQPEVATHVTITMTNVQDVVLVAGTYDDETTAATGDSFTLTENYYPVKFTLWQISGVDGVNYTPARELKTGTLAQIKAFLDDYSATAYYAPNTILNSVFEITWTWAIDGNNQADTYLGNRAAAGTTDASYVLNVGFDISITVEQVD